VFAWYWVDGRAGCGRWCGVRGAVVWLSYPVVLASRWSVFPVVFVYPVTDLRVAAGVFVLELPELVYLVLLVFERFALVYPAFAVFELPLLVLGFPVCVSLVVLVFECWVSGGRWWVASYLVSVLLDPLLSCIQLLSLYLPFSRFLSLLRSPLSLLRSPLSLLFSILCRFRLVSLFDLRCGRGSGDQLDRWSSWNRRDVSYVPCLIESFLRGCGLGYGGWCGCVSVCGSGSCGGGSLRWGCGWCGCVRLESSVWA
jgi:hypothetical protein